MRSLTLRRCFSGDELLSQSVFYKPARSIQYSISGFRDWCGYPEITIFLHTWPCAMTRSKKLFLDPDGEGFQRLLIWLWRLMRFVKWEQVMLSPKQ